jgi:hypothetical protein
MVVYLRKSISVREDLGLDSRFDKTDRTVRKESKTELN